jgi:crotonobetainyl-CoA:carnitine CoA-transferase CaiB-like acyl-CoA transferase
VNRNKRSVVLDLREQEGRRDLNRLLESADLLVHNYRPATAARLGVDAGELRARHPGLVVASVGGFPGADANRPAYDLLAQAVSGLMSITGPPEGPPTKVGVALLDLLAGLECAIGALAALVGRGRVGRVEVGLVEAGVSGLINVLGNHLATGREPVRHGNAHPNIVPYQAFSAADGDMVVAVGNDAQFERLCAALGLAADLTLTTNAQRLERRSEVTDRLQAAIGRRIRGELLDALAAADVPAAPVHGMTEAVEAMERAHPDGWVVTVDGVRLPPPPIHVDGAAPQVRRAPPRLGEHTAEVLAELP